MDGKLDRSLLWKQHQEPCCRKATPGETAREDQRGPEKYQARLADEKISDRDFTRSLSEAETTLVHNAWMNDVSAWMNETCLEKYNELMSQESTKGKGKGSAGKPASSARKRSAGKPASSAGKGPGQRAQQLKNQRFNKVINDIARSKALVMSFIRRPRMRTPEGLTLFLTELEEYKKTPAYQEMATQSEKRTEERTQLKRKRTDARFKYKQGERDFQQKRDTELAKSFRSGELARECEAAEEAYTTRQHEGAARTLGNRGACVD